MNEIVSAHIFHKSWVYVLATTVVIFSISFYWFAMRPASIKKQCSTTMATTYSEGEKVDAKNYVEANCKRGSLRIYGNSECSLRYTILGSPTTGEYPQRPATNEQYEQCLRENGL